MTVSVAHTKKLMKLGLSLFRRGFSSSEWYVAFVLKMVFVIPFNFLNSKFYLFIYLFCSHKQNGSEDGRC